MHGWIKVGFPCCISVVSQFTTTTVLLVVAAHEKLCTITSTTQPEVQRYKVPVPNMPA